jgi:hypothetical protein
MSPVRAAVTRRFSLGVPRSITIVGPEGARSVLYLRSDAGTIRSPTCGASIRDTGASTRLLDARELGGAERTCRTRSARGANASASRPAA